MRLSTYLLDIMKDEKKTPDARAIRPFLSLFSFLYRLVLACVYALYRMRLLPSYRAPVKVISVGNMTLGGTGKTPFSVRIAGDVRSMGGRPAVLSRGYGDDESHLLKEKLRDIPVLTGRDRVRNAERAFSELGSDCVILDDGFQHYRLRRDLDILLIDATSALGDMKLFPRGVLREPLGRLRDADMAILTKTDMGRANVSSIRAILKKFNGDIDILESSYRPVLLRDVFSGATRPVSAIRGRKAAAMSGIGNPAYFEWMLAKAGAQVAVRLRYPDHHMFTYGDIERAAENCIKGSVGLIVTTEKDAVKIKRLDGSRPGIEMLALEIDVDISPDEEALLGRLRSVFNS